MVWTRVRFPKDKEEVCTEKVKNAVYLFMSLTLGVWMNQKIFYVILKEIVEHIFLKRETEMQRDKLREGRTGTEAGGKRRHREGEQERGPWAGRGEPGAP